MSSGQPSVAWREATGQSEDVVPEKALFSDLVVFAAARSEMAPTLRPTFEAVLLKARRPILLAPAELPEHVGHNVAIAWNGMPEAKECSRRGHAVSRIGGRSPSADCGERPNRCGHARRGVSNYLAWHGIGSDAHILEASGEPLGPELMQKAMALGADLLVMGGYGHTRLRERILGGVTYHMVNQPELPILLAH